MKRTRENSSSAALDCGDPEPCAGPQQRLPEAQGPRVPDTQGRFRGGRRALGPGPGSGPFFWLLFSFISSVKSRGRSSLGTCVCDQTGGGDRSLAVTPDRSNGGDEASEALGKGTVSQPRPPSHGDIPRLSSRGTPLSPRCTERDGLRGVQGPFQGDVWVPGDSDHSRRSEWGTDTL